MRAPVNSITLLTTVAVHLALLSWTEKVEAVPAADDAVTGGPDENALTGSASEEHAQGGAAVAVTLNLAGFGLFGPDLNIAYGSEFTGFVRARGFGLPST